MSISICLCHCQAILCAQLNFGLNLGLTFFFLAIFLRYSFCFFVAESSSEKHEHDFFTLLRSTEKLLTRAGFELAPSGTPVRRSAVELSSHWERCAYFIQFKFTRYCRDDLTLSVRIYRVLILFQISTILIETKNRTFYNFLTLVRLTLYQIPFCN